MPFDPKKPCKTREGYEVVIYETDCPALYPITGRYKNHNGRWQMQSWLATGHVPGSNGRHTVDLVNLPEIITIPTRYVNVYRTEHGITLGVDLDLDRSIALAVGSSIVARLTLNGTYDLGYGLTNQEKLWLQTTN